MNAILDNLIDILIKANTAQPLIMGVVATIASIWQATTGESISLSEYATRIETKCAANKAYGEAEVARLKALRPPQS